jgi:outer membrane autotransporter protein
VFDTWNYLPPRPFPANPASEYGWAYDRVELNPGFSDAVRREFGANWGNAAVGQSVALNLAGPNGQQGWLGRGVTVAVIDGGIDARFATNNPFDGFAYVHPEFAGRLDIRSRRIFANGNWDLLIQDTPGSHGVHVAGTIAAAADGVGMMGVAPMANILALKAVGSTAGDPIQSMLFAGSLQDVRIINGSYGPSATAGETTWTTGELDAEFFAVRQAVANGKVLVFATGNDFQTAPVQAQNPTGVPLFPFINPRNARHGAYNDGGRNYDFSILNRLPGFIVAVANLDHNFRISADSNRCGVAAAWCVSAPGGGTNGGTNQGILSTVVRGVERIEDTPEASPPMAVGPDANLGYAYLNGTSMATPHVSGVIAVLMEAYPIYSPRDIVRLLFATTDDLGSRGVDRIFGHGLVRLDRALLAGPNVANIPDDFVPNLVPGQRTVWAAPISTDRELVVQGFRGAPRAAPDGDLVIAGVSEFRGGVEVKAGELVVDGTLKAPSVHVAADAWLYGDGEVVGNVTVDGVLKPGSGPGSIVIVGNVALNPDALFLLEMDGYSDEGGPGSYSHLWIEGAGNAFTAGGTAIAAFRGQFEGADNTFTPSIGDRFQIVEAVDGARVVGRFARLETQEDETGDTGLAPGSRLSLIYQPTSVTLAVNPQSFGDLRVHGVGLGARQSAVGRALDRMEDAATSAVTGPASDIYDRLAGLGPAKLASALEQMSGSGHAAVVRGALSSSRQLSGLIGQRTDGLRTGAANAAFDLPALSFTRDGAFSGASHQALARFAPAGEPSAAPVTPQFAIWGRVFGQSSRVGGDGVSAAINGQGGGVVVGGDMMVMPGLTLGIAGAYARNHSSGGGLKGDAKSYLAAFYGSYTRGGLEIDVQAGLNRSDFNTTRQIAIGDQTSSASSKSRGVGLIADGEVGYRSRFDMGVPAWVKPFIGVSYNDLDQAQFTETGAGALGLLFPAQRFTTLQSRVGMAAGASFVSGNGVTYHAEVNAAWARHVDDGARAYSAVLAGQPMNLVAAQIGRDGVLVRARMTAVLSQAFAMHAGYSSEHRVRYVSHRLEGGIRMSW